MLAALLFSRAATALSAAAATANATQDPQLPPASWSPGGFTRLKPPARTQAFGGEILVAVKTHCTPMLRAAAAKHVLDVAVVLVTEGVHGICSLSFLGMFPEVKLSSHVTVASVSCCTWILHTPKQRRKS